MITDWINDRVIHGKKIGRVLGFPTINLENPKLLEGEREGVYLSEIQINGKKYHGVLFFGPRLILKEKEKVLEIFLIDFDENVYGKEVSFRLLEYIRGVRNFKSKKSFQKQLSADFQKAREIISSL